MVNGVSESIGIDLKILPSKVSNFYETARYVFGTFSRLDPNARAKYTNT